MLNCGSQPSAMREDQVPSDVIFGLVAGTRVATQFGWRAIEGVIAGDKVLTFDAGLQTVIGARRETIRTTDAQADASEWPLLVPAGTLGNRSNLTLLPNQAVLIESDIADEAFGDPFALIPALALEGYRGIAHVPPPPQIEMVQLEFALDEVIFANIGSLMFCPSKRKPRAKTMHPPYHVLTLEQADALVGVLEIEDAARKPKIKLSRHGASVAA